MAPPPHPSGITLRLRFGLPHVATREAALTVCARVTDELNRPAARQAVHATAGQFSLVADHPPLGLWLSRAMSDESNGLVRAQVEYVEGPNTVLRVDLADPNGLRSVLRAEARAREAAVAAHGLLRAFRWMARRFIGNDRVARVAQEADARAALERENHTHALMRMQILLAVAAHLAEVLDDPALRCWLLCPGSPASPMEIPHARLRQMKDEKVAAQVAA